MNRFLLLTAIVALTGCAHKPEDFRADATTADQKCLVRQFNTAVDKENCFTAEESAVVNRDLPFATQSFSRFAEARDYYARHLDEETADALIPYKEFVHEYGMYAALLIAKDPRAGQPQAQLSKDVVGLNLRGVCGDAVRGAEKWAMCEISLMRAVWERDAKDTISSFDEWAQHFLAVSKKYDATGAPFAISNAQQVFTTAMNQAVRDFYADAKHDEQAAIAKAQYDKEQAQAESAQNLKALGDFIGALGKASLVAAVAVGEARASAAPTATVAPIQPSPTMQHTTCQRNALFNTVNCTTTNY